MSCNYYARIIPSKERKKELCEAIEANDFPLIQQLTDKMYGRLERDFDNELIDGEVHLGEASGGWKFLWNPNVYVVRNGHMEDVNGSRRYVPDPDTPLYLYPLTKQGLHDFIFRDDVLIYDEYSKLKDKEEFWQKALAYGQENGWDAAGYEKEYLNHIYPVTGELTDLLKAEGYQFTSMSNSDFYSDGLRFAGFTDFS